MKYLSLFSGIGGFEYGIEKAYRNQQSSTLVKDRKGRNGDADERGHDVLSTSGTAPLCIGFSEIDKYAIQIYKKHYPTHPYLGDVTRIVPESLPDFDLICGGFPCQAFSIAGKRGGFEDTRGTLFFEIARIARVKRPKLLLLENVKGLLSHDNGRTFGTILATLSDMGYFCEWQVLNSKDFGVPQNRERVFIVGHLGGGSGRKVFPIQASDGNSDKDIKIKRVAHSKSFRTVNQTFSTDGHCEAINTCGGGGHQPCIPVLTPNRPVKRQNGRRFKENGDPAFTCTAQDQHGVFDGMRVRRLTPTECERLQAYPDGWTEGISDSQMYKCLGNSVTTSVITAIMERILSL